VLKIAAIASWQPRPGRKPYDFGSNRASHSGSNALTTWAWRHLSKTTGTMASYCLPVDGSWGLGMWRSVVIGASEVA
jgi:hypothetical protein